jgi:hypothetical protein
MLWYSILFYAVIVLLGIDFSIYGITKKSITSLYIGNVLFLAGLFLLFEIN